ncbi:putative ABC transporter permease/ATP-binding protein [Vibrio halioticoli NBRC 102217]|uniref:Putative ABC transporter permease/ATP-binding protein n=1 Tax=Vibrio halioticoli NBRC 102217 TaxID=1219072 RepID=V5FHU1_9VIBR|nr:ABC transporter transmembrane domain-containing protein [Vibrio halioticoli]GAD88582.1 putative ABC transporter permease/ATP-binding protein [Vibrio halioticoli NBRC 102217]
MNQSYSDSVLNVLTIIKVESGVQNFANQWLQSNPMYDAEDIFTLLDRLMIPYSVHPANRKLKSIDHLVAIRVNADSGTVCHYGLTGYTEYDDGELVAATVDHSINDVVILIHGQPQERNEVDWLASKLSNFKPLIPKLLLVSFIANLFALSIPFITMSVYDHVIGGDAGHEVVGISVGAILLFSMMLLLKVIRSQLLTTISNRISREVSESVLRKILFSQLNLTRMAGSSTLMSRITTAESLKSVAQGPLGGALFDLPFVIIFIVAIGVLGGWLVIVPIVTLALYWLLAKRSQKQQRLLSNQVTISGTSRFSLLYELNGKLNYLRSSDILPHWMSRFEKANTLASKNSFSHLNHQAKYTSIYYAISLLSTLAVIGLGIGLIFGHVLTAGGLIATMMLISRVTSPAQMLANSYSRLHHVEQTKQQINQSINHKAEGDFSYQHHHLTDQAPSVELELVTLRFANQLKPALSSVSFKAEPGQVIAITGPMASGKTSLLEVIAGLIPAQNGVIKLNGINLSQYDPQLLRQWFGYYSDLPEMVPITIQEFISDGHEVPVETIEAVLKQKGALSWVNSLPDGLQTHLNQIESMSHPFSDYEATLLTQTKLLCNQYPLVLLDNPVTSNKAKQQFIQWLTANRGKSTIIFTSHDTELIKLSDQVVVLNAGNVSYAGPIPDETEQQVQPDQPTQVIEG